MEAVIHPLLIDGEYCPKSQKPYPCPPGKTAIKIENVQFRNVSGTSTLPVVGWFNCSAISPCTNITLEDIDLTQANGEPAEFRCTAAHGAAVGSVTPESCLLSGLPPL